MERRRKADQGDQATGVSFGMLVDPVTTCAICGKDRELPEPGKRHPVGAGSTLVVTADTSCPQCGSMRVKVVINIQ